MEAVKLPIKGTIICPECNKTIAFVYADADGHSSVRCFQCKKTVLIDYVKLYASVIPPIKRFNKKSIPSK